MVPVVTPAEAADVGGDELTRISDLANHIDLHLLEVAPGVADEAAMVEQQAGIAAGAGQRNFFPAVVGLAPVGRDPGAIQRVERSIFPLEPCLELTAGLRVEGFFGVFIPNLPADDVWIVPEAARKLLRDGRAEFAVRGARVIELAAAAMFRGAACGVDAQCFRMSCSEPCRRRVGGRAD